LLIDLLQELPGHDRPDYWLGRAVDPIRWTEGSIERQISHVIVAARFQPMRIDELTREEMRLAGYPDSMSEIDVCQ
jgi:hypothetical protein